MFFIKIVQPLMTSCLLLLLGVSDLANGRPHQCTEPDRIGHVNVKKFADDMGKLTFSLLPEYRLQTSVYRLANDCIPSHYFNIQRTLISMDTEDDDKCHFSRPATVSSLRRFRLYSFPNERALCQVEVFKNYDNNRIPKVILESTCACSYVTGLGEKIKCEAVTLLLPVMRRALCDSNGKYVYSNVFEEVSVGCRAVRELPQIDITASDGNPRPEA